MKNRFRSSRVSREIGRRDAFVVETNLINRKGAFISSPKKMVGVWRTRDILDIVLVFVERRAHTVGINLQNPSYQVYTQI